MSRASLPRLRTLFLRAAATSASALVAACSSGLVPVPAGDGGLPQADFDISLCTGSTFEPLAGVTPAVAVDYAELRVEHQQATDGGLNAIGVTGATGTKCATATDTATCETALASLRWSGGGWSSPSGFGRSSPVVNYLAYTRGDDVATVATKDFATFLGPIDNAKDAALLAMFKGYRVECSGRPGMARKTPEGFELLVVSGDTCGPGTHKDEHRVRVDAAGAVTVLETQVIEPGNPQCSYGRRPEGLVVAESAVVCDLGGLFAEAAVLEAASVVSFERLAAELSALGAPPDLVRAALRARDDEKRHAKMTSRMARHHGAEPAAFEVADVAPRGLFQVALENAVEGCVRETYSALVATVQAARAGDRRVARVMKHIAADETRHAALAWDVAAWLAPQLSDDERAAIADAQAEAIADLRRDVGAGAPPALRAQAGLPDGAEARRLVDWLVPELWAA